mgnify:CR=1 FL=1
MPPLLKAITSESQNSIQSQNMFKIVKRVTMNLEGKKKLWEAKRAQITALRIAKAEAWRAELAAKREEKTAPKIETPEKTKPIKKIVVKKKPEAKTKKRKKLKIAKKKVQAKKPEKIPTTKPKDRKKIKTIKKKVVVKKKIEKTEPGKKKAVLEKGKELIEEILKEPFWKEATAKEIVEETVVPNIEEQKKEAEPAEKKTATLSGRFTDISIPQKTGKKDLDAEKFKELEEKLKRLRRF